MTTVSRARLTFLVLLETGAAAFLFGWSVLWVSRGSYPTALVIVAAAIYLLGLGLHMAYVVWGTPRARTEHSPAGTVVRPPRWADQMFFMSFASAVLAAVLYLCFLPLGLIDFHLPESSRRVDVAICVFLIAFGAPTLIRGVVRGGEGHLRLAPDGFEVWNGFWGSFVRGAWDDVEQISDQPLRGRKLPRGVIVIGRGRRRSAMFMSDTVTEDSAALREWVRFYWQHPEHRDELVDGRGLRRLGELSFTSG